IKDIDAQIAVVQRNLQTAPPLLSNKTIMPNQRITQLETDIGATKAKLDARQAELGRLTASRVSTPVGIQARNERIQAQLQRDVDRHKTAVATYTKSVDELTQRKLFVHDPVSIIAPAGPAEPVGSQRTHNVLLAAI